MVLVIDVSEVLFLFGSVHVCVMVCDNFNERKNVSMSALCNVQICRIPTPSPAHVHARLGTFINPQTRVCTHQEEASFVKIFAALMRHLRFLLRRHTSFSFWRPFAIPSELAPALFFLQPLPFVENFLLFPIYVPCHLCPGTVDEEEAKWKAVRQKNNSIGLDKICNLSGDLELLGGIVEVLDVFSMSSRAPAFPSVL